MSMFLLRTDSICNILEQRSEEATRLWKGSRSCLWADNKPIASIVVKKLCCFHACNGRFLPQKIMEANGMNILHRNIPPESMLCIHEKKFLMEKRFVHHFWQPHSTFVVLLGQLTRCKVAVFKSNRDRFAEERLFCSEIDRKISVWNGDDAHYASSWTSYKSFYWCSAIHERALSSIFSSVRCIKSRR